MSDTRSRALERAAASGSVDDQARALVARLRTAPGCERCGGTGRVWVHLSRRHFAREETCPPCAGTGSPFRARVELAAFAGHEAAAATLQPFADDPYVASGAPTACSPCVAGDRRNYTFAGDGSWWCLKHAHEHHDLALWLRGLARWSDIGPAPGWALRMAAVAAARAALTALRCDDPHSSHPDWQAPRGHRATAWLPPPGQDAERHRDAIRHAARLAGESPVLNAIRSSLIEWSLGGEK
jgi:hypothetical protein